MPNGKEFAKWPKNIKKKRLSDHWDMAALVSTPFVMITVPPYLFLPLLDTNMPFFKAMVITLRLSAGNWDEELLVELPEWSLQLAEIELIVENSQCYTDKRDVASENWEVVAIYNVQEVLL